MAYLCLFKIRPYVIYKRNKIRAFLSLIIEIKIYLWKIDESLFTNWLFFLNKFCDYLEKNKRLASFLIDFPKKRKILKHK